MKEQNDLYLCEECGLFYEDPSWAEKCEKWCQEHNSCNIEITKHSVPKSNLSLE